MQSAGAEKNSGKEDPIRDEIPRRENISTTTSAKPKTITRSWKNEKSCIAGYHI
jgi:hypothetical protein